MPPYRLTNFKTQKYNQNETRFTSVYSKNILFKIKDKAFEINYGEYKSTETHWVALYMNVGYTAYFDSFGFKTFQTKMKNSLETNIW